MMTMRKGREVVGSDRPEFVKVYLPKCFILDILKGDAVGASLVQSRIIRHVHVFVVYEVVIKFGNDFYSFTYKSRSSADAPLKYHKDDEIGVTLVTPKVTPVTYWFPVER